MRLLRTRSSITSSVFLVSPVPSASPVLSRNEDGTVAIGPDCKPSPAPLSGIMSVTSKTTGRTSVRLRSSYAAVSPAGPAPMMMAVSRLMILQLMVLQLTDRRLRVSHFPHGERPWDKNSPLPVGEGPWYGLCREEYTGRPRSDRASIPRKVSPASLEKRDRSNPAQRPLGRRGNSDQSPSLSRSDRHNYAEWRFWLV